MKIELRKGFYPHKYILHPNYTRTVLTNAQKKGWCMNHVTGRVGFNQETGKAWKKCSIGYKTNTGCDIHSG